jgi:hypothetical protein
MLHQPRLRALEERHAALERRILEENGRPARDSDAVVRLKREKLRLKDEMDRLRNGRVASA